MLWNRPIMSIRQDLLTIRDTHVTKGKRRRRNEAIIEILYRDNRIPARKVDIMRVETRQESYKEYAEECETEK